MWSDLTPVDIAANVVALVIIGAIILGLVGDATRDKRRPPRD